MTNKEAIKILDGAELMLFNRTFAEFNAAILKAIAALKAQDEKARPPP